jgi:hypothetical protein
LVIDDFAVKHVGKEHADHLLAALSEHYEVSADWEWDLFCGIKLDWDYENQTIDLSMPGYVKDILHKYQQRKPKHPQNALYCATRPQYGKIQYTDAPDEMPCLLPNEAKQIQGITGSLLWYSQAVDPTMRVA